MGAIPSITTLCDSFGLENVKVAGLGGYHVLISYADVEVFLRIAKEFDVQFLDIFSSLDWWSSEFVVESRSVWVRSFGIPLPAWSPVVFESIAGKLGVFLGVGKETLEKSHLEFGKVCIHTDFQGFINQSFEIEVCDKMYPILIREELEGKRRPFLVSLGQRQGFFKSSLGKEVPMEGRRYLSVDSSEEEEGEDAWKWFSGVVVELGSSFPAGAMDGVGGEAGGRDGRAVTGGSAGSKDARLLSTLSRMGGGQRGEGRVQLFHRRGKSMGQELESLGCMQKEPYLLGRVVELEEADGVRISLHHGAWGSSFIIAWLSRIRSIGFFC